jgi:hypothetical protein
MRVARHHPAQSTPKTNLQFEVENASPPLQSHRDDDMTELEREFHARTWIALAAFLLLNYTQVLALQGPAAVVSVYDVERRTLSHYEARFINN